MYTKKSYQNDPYKAEISAVITSVSEQNSQKIVTFDQTIFSPAGGGQSCDTGSIFKVDDLAVEVNVTDVYEKNNQIYHVINQVNGKLNKGDKIIMRLDWERRFDNMQRHCGEHILSGAFYRLFGGTNKGFHMGEGCITIDIAFDENSKYDRITWEMAAAAELDSNKVIWSDAPVTVEYFEKRADAENMPLRKPLAFDEDISIVTIGDKSDPVDCVACCGTHPSTAGQVGLIKIYKIEPNKGMSRVFFEAGERAYHNYYNQFNTLYELGNQLSAGPEDILSKYDSQTARNIEMRERLHTLTAHITGQEIERIRGDLSLDYSGRRIFIYEYSFLVPDDILNIGKGISDIAEVVVALADTSSDTLFLFSDGQIPCGKLIKKYAADFGGRGGGKDSMARASFPDSKSLHDFLSCIQNANMI